MARASRFPALISPSFIAPAWCSILFDDALNIEMFMRRPLIRYSRLQLLAYRQGRRISTDTITPQSTEKPSADQSADNIVQIVEVGPRDGLQNENNVVPLATKIKLIERLSQTGLTDIEAGSFVSPKWVPQMAESDGVLRNLLKNRTNTTTDPVYYSFLVPNLKGLRNALSILKTHPDTYNTTDMPEQVESSSTEPPKPYIETSVFASATESFSQKNLNCSIADSLAQYKTVIQAAKDHNLRVRAYISVVLGCPFEGYDVSPHRVAEIAASLLEMGADEIALGDTTGMGTVPRTATLLKTLASAGIRMEDLAMHFHDTYGQALVNTAVSLEHGIRTFDASVGGLGGCPFSPGATGNVGTEDMVYFLESLGMDTGVDLNRLAEIGEWIAGELGADRSSRVGRAWLGRRIASKESQGT